MRAAVLRDGEVVVAELADLTPGPRQVLIEPLACGICGTDLHMVHHAGELGDAARAAGGGFAEHLDPRRDFVMGHETSCRVLAVGDDVTGLDDDATYVAMPYLKTPNGVVTPGYDNDYPGGFAEQMLVSPSALVRIPNGLDPTIAALTEPIAVGVHAVNESSISRDRVAVVVGAGPVGLAIIAALTALGVETIIASDFAGTRRAAASTMGAHVVVDPAASDPIDAWRSAGNGQTPPVIFECVGVPGVLDAVMATAPSHSEIIIAGVCIPPDTFHPSYGVFKHLSLKFVLGWSIPEFVESLDHLAEGRVDGRLLITGEVGLDDVPTAFDELSSPGHHVKVMVRPGL